MTFYDSWHDKTLTLADVKKVFDAENSGAQLAPTFKYYMHNVISAYMAGQNDGHIIGMTRDEINRLSARLLPYYMYPYGFTDIESGKTVTVKQLYRNYRDSISSGKTDFCTFTEFIRNCITKHNGTLEPITEARMKEKEIIKQITITRESIRGDIEYLVNLMDGDEISLPADGVKSCPTFIDDCISEVVDIIELYDRIPDDDEMEDIIYNMADDYGYTDREDM